jgi:hypothetical protein
MKQLVYSVQYTDKCIWQAVWTILKYSILLEYNLFKQHILIRLSNICNWSKFSYQDRGL